MGLEPVEILSETAIVHRDTLSAHERDKAAKLTDSHVVTLCPAQGFEARNGAVVPFAPDGPGASHLPHGSTQADSRPMHRPLLGLLMHRIQHQRGMNGIFLSLIHISEPTRRS